MTADTRSWFAKVRGYRQTDFSTQAAVLLPVVIIAGLTAWMVLSGASSAKSQSVSQSVAAPAPAIAAPEKTSLADPAPAPSEIRRHLRKQLRPQIRQPRPAESPPAEASPLDGLKISSQSWRRGGLGSNALVTFTLRNNNDYAVKDIEIACAFNRRDGSHLTDRTRCHSRHRQYEEPQDLRPHACRFRQYQCEPGEMFAGRRQPHLSVPNPKFANDSPRRGRFLGTSRPNRNRVAGSEKVTPAVEPDGWRQEPINNISS